MSDEVAGARRIGAMIERGSGTLPRARRKKVEKEKEDKGPKKVKSKRIVEKDDPNIIDAEVVEPIKVKSERVDAPKELTTGQRQLGFNRYDIPTHGPGSEFNPNVGRQFRDNKPKSGNELDEVTGPINPRGNPTGKYVNPTGPIF
jgi:hypothetical protein